MTRERIIELWDFFSRNYAIFCAWQRDHDAGISIEPLITQNRHVTRSGRPLLDRPQGVKIQQGERVLALEIIIQWIPTADMLADIFTKCLDKTTFLKLRDMLLTEIG